MSWHNSPLSWTEMERKLSGRDFPRDSQHPGDGGDSPAWTRKRQAYKRDERTTASSLSRTSYAELHCHSHFSFLDGASYPEELVEQAASLGLDAIAITDHDGMYGVVRFAEAAAEVGMRAVYGAELSIGLSAPQKGIADPQAQHLLVLARDAEGYHRLCEAISEAQLAGEEKGRPRYRWDRLAEHAGGHWLVLTGCRKATVPAALAADGVEAATAELNRLVELFGRDHVAVELTDHGLPVDSKRNDRLAELAATAKLPTVATNAVHYASPDRARLASVLASIRARRSLDDMDGWLPAAGMAYLRSPEEMAHRFARYPDAVAHAAELGRECALDLRLVAPALPPFDTPKGHTESSWLRELVYRGAADRYGSPMDSPDAYQQIEHELAVIEQREFPGYFLVVSDIVGFCLRNDILCQGRGSAANSAVCYALRISKVDSVRYGLLFERFLSPVRDGPPDIDLDIESDRREEVIQYVYLKYGRTHAAQVANVITYRTRSAVRDVAKAFGFSTGQQDAWSKEAEQWGPTLESPNDHTASEIPEHVRDTASQLVGFPRHLGIHSGGMVICDQPVSRVCPVEWARMPGRTVLQWDKDDCASINLVKFDLLGLGMLSALHYATDLVAEYHGVPVDIGTLKLDDDNVYAMLRRADAVGVFQVESRAQLATLPRLQPREFYDLVVEVALIRPGPIQGGSVHPYIRRRNGDEKWDYEHPMMENSLSKTYGVPLFQEQLMQMAVDLANFTPAEADELRRAMGAKRSAEKMRKLRQRLFSGMAANHITGELAERIYDKLLAFANFGFPESHAHSFALIVYASAWFKYYYPAAFCTALLRAQPMGFYSPQSLVADARRHGVPILKPDINASLAHPNLEKRADATSSGTPFAAEDAAVRMGLATIRSLGQQQAQAIVDERTSGGAYRDMTDLARRVRLSTTQWEALATAGAFENFGHTRRQALWAAGATARENRNTLPGTESGVRAPRLPVMGGIEQAAADVWATGLSPDSFPLQFLRDKLDNLGVTPATQLLTEENGGKVLVAGAVTHRQRPATAGGITFINLEDETGMINIVCSQGLWARYRKIAQTSSALLVRGVVEKTENVINIRAERLQRLDIGVPTTSRDFH